MRIALDEALRALAIQQTLVDSLRARATLLVAAAALPGALSAGGGPIGWSGGVAVTCLAGVVACVFVICAPWWTWRFRTDVSLLLRNIDSGHDLDSLHRNLARSYEVWTVHNDAKIRQLQWWFTGGLGFLAVELAAWTAHNFGW